MRGVVFFPIFASCVIPVTRDKGLQYNSCPPQGTAVFYDLSHCGTNWYRIVNKTGYLIVRLRDNGRDIFILGGRKVILPESEVYISGTRCLSPILPGIDWRQACLHVFEFEAWDFDSYTGLPTYQIGKGCNKTSFSPNREADSVEMNYYHIGQGC